MAVSNPAYRSSAEKLAVSDCLAADQLSFDQMLLRGYIFAALYKQDFGRALPESSSKPINFFSGLNDDSSHDALLQAQMLTFADCVVRKDSASSRAFLIGAVGSISERAALDRLVPELGSCMQQGARVRFNKTTLYGLLAEAAYREASEARSASRQNMAQP